MSKIYLARQPIVTLDEHLQAYDIMYLDSNKEVNISTDFSASASVINSILNSFGTQNFLTQHKAFIKIDEKFLMSDLIETIPVDIFIFAFFGEIAMTHQVVERLSFLHSKGFTLAIHDIKLEKVNILKYQTVMDKLSYVKVEIGDDTNLEDKVLVEEFQKNDIKVVATRIESSVQYQLSKDLGCDLYQGYWFSKPKVVENTNFDSSQFNVLKLYNMLINDTNIDEITSEFENNHALSIQLLQFINSANFHFRTEISSIHHVLMLVGRKPLSQWLMLMIYSKSITKNEKVSPLMLMVKNRTELMQNLLKILKPDVKSNALGEAYLVGVLSLIEIIFKAKLEDILDRIHISDIARKALLKDEGTLGTIYKVVRDIEEFNISGIIDFSKKYKVSEEAIQEVILKSIEDVNEFEDSLKGSNS